MTQLNPPVEVQEVRRRPRFNMRSRIDATFSGLPATVTNISAEGVGLQHASPIRINSAGAIRIESDENSGGVAFRGRVRWSRLSRTANQDGKYLYSTGVQIEEASDAAAGLLGRLIRAFGERDRDSLATKKKTVEEKIQSRSTLPAILQPRSSAPAVKAEQVLLIREASLALENHPESAQEWYNRARFSMVKRDMIADEMRSIPYRREVIVIWEYLGGKVDLDVITMVLDSETKRQHPVAPIER